MAAALTVTRSGKNRRRGGDRGESGSYLGRLLFLSRFAIQLHPALPIPEVSREIVIVLPGLVKLGIFTGFAVREIV